MDEKKVQWSKFSPDRSEQFVIRTDTWEEMTELRSKVLGIVPQGKAFPDDDGKMATPPEKVQASVPVCPDHSKPMKYGKYGWFCATKVGNGWCKYKIA